jgi:hypothetical protein
MRRQIFLTVTFLLFFFIAFGQFKPNSIGVCYLQHETADEYSLTISLPLETLLSESRQPEAEFKEVIDTITYNGQIILFDDKGELCSINNKEKLLVEFWCENDGGTQFRPTLKATIKKNKLLRQLSGIIVIQNICCFALLNKSNFRIEETKLKNLSSIKLKGDFDKNGKYDCAIWTYKDDAGNCDGKPDNNLMIMLQVGKKSYGLRCCGP